MSDLVDAGLTNTQLRERVQHIRERNRELTRERDEARAEVERLKAALLEIGSLPPDRNLYDAHEIAVEALAPKPQQEEPEDRL